MIRDLEFEVSTLWGGDGDARYGLLETGGREIEYSAPLTMGGSGEGTNPEELLLGAVATCYSLGLSHLLHKRDLQATSLSVRAHGYVSGYPLAAKFARIIVTPTIAGADIARAADYEAAANAARDRCFIGKTLAASVSYEVGQVAFADGPNRTLGSKASG
jgi:peroxiredoxin-like protein